MKLIAFTGQMGVGKSTAVETLRTWRYMNTGFANVKFAAPLYDIQEYIYNRISSVHRRPADFVKDRKLLQWIGTEWGRETIKDSIWVDLWANKVKEIHSYWTKAKMDCVITCDDCRFDNEAQTIRTLGGVIIKLTSNKNLDRVSTTDGLKNHASESGINENMVDYTVHNDYTKEDFELRLKHLFQQIVEQNQRR